MTLQSLLFTSERHKCIDESQHRADARHHRAAPRLNGSDGIKNAHKHDKTQLPETWEERTRGAARARRGETRRVASAEAFNCVSRAYSVMVPGGAALEDGDNADHTQRDWSEAFGHSLTQLLLLPNPTFNALKAFIELPHRDEIIWMHGPSAGKRYSKTRCYRGA